MLDQNEASEILVGFSGGADSTALLLYLNQHYPQKIKAIHFNHQIRKESDKEESWCSNFCKNRNINFESFKLDVLNQKNSNEAIEEAARRLRLQSWKTLSSQNSVIALAHHKDDINENFFIRLMRGSGLRGLTGLKPLTEVEKLTFWRPLLNKSKNELIQFLKENGVTEWCEDKSNQKNDYRRNKIRNQLIPLYKEISGGTHSLENSIKVLTEEANFLDQLSETYFTKIKEMDSLEAWLKVPKVLMARVLTSFIQSENESYFVPTAATVDRLINELNSATHKEKQVPLRDNLTLIVSNQGVKLATELQNSQTILWNPLKEKVLSFREQTVHAEVVNKMGKANQTTQFFDLDKLSVPLKVRTFEPGDKIKTFSGFTKKVKKLFSDQKVPKSERQSTAIIESAEKIIWIACLTRSNIATVSDSTKRILKLSIKSR